MKPSYVMKGRLKLPCSVSALKGSLGCFVMPAKWVCSSLHKEANSRTPFLTTLGWNIFHPFILLARGIASHKTFNSINVLTRKEKKVMQSSMKHQQNQPGKKVKGPILQGHFFPPSLFWEEHPNWLIDPIFIWNECEISK